MKKYLILFISIISFTAFVGCSEDDDIEAPNYVAFQQGFNAGVEPGGNATYDVKVYTANITGEDRQFTVNVDPTTTLNASAYTVPSSVTIPGGTNEGTLSISVSDVDLGLEGKRLFLSLGQEPELSTGAPVRINVVNVCPGSEFVIDFVLDAYPGETGYELLDSEGNSVIKVNSNPGATRSLCLPSGTYTFILRDSYGDGILDGGATISYAGAVLATLSGDFAAETSVEVSF
jgi:hypothetical protein